jgi:sugar/nucleoside kinase (ribokinase family)
MKGIINLRGYRIKVDESIHPGNYCFKIHHDRERTFYFYTEHEKSMKDWLKALMKATIARDFTSEFDQQSFYFSDN